MAQRIAVVGGLNIGNIRGRNDRRHHRKLRIFGWIDARRCELPRGYFRELTLARVKRRPRTATAAAMCLVLLHGGLVRLKIRSEQWGHPLFNGLLYRLQGADEKNEGDDSD